MKIGFLYIHAPGESMGSINRVRFLCNGLTRLNHKCYIFTPYDYLEDWGPLIEFVKISESISSKVFLTKLYQTARWILNSRYISNLTLLQPKFLELTSKKIASDLIKKIQEKGYHLDVLIGEQELSCLALIQVKNKINSSIVMNLHNYWPEELVEHKIIKRNGKIYNNLVHIERKLIQSGDLVITNGKFLRDFLINKFTNIDKTKIKSIPNGRLPFLNEPKKKSFPPKIINAGMVVQRSNPKFFLDCIPYILRRYPESQIYITRRGDQLEPIMKLAKKKNLNINFYWKESYSEFLKFLSECHVGVITSSYELTRKLGIASKILDYLSVGIPVVGNDIGGWTSLIQKEKVGLLSSKNPKDLANKILYLIDNPEINYQFGQNAINLMKDKFNIDNIAKEFVSYLNYL